MGEDVDYIAKDLLAVANPCDGDGIGHCREHGWYELRECPYKRLARWLADQTLVSA